MSVVVGVEAQAADRQAGILKARGGAADFPAGGVTFRGYVARLGAGRGGDAHARIVNRATHRGDSGARVTIGVYLASLNPGYRAGADLLAGTDAGENAGQPALGVAGGIVGAIHRTRGRRHARLARRAVVAAHLALGHVAVLVDVAGVIATGTANPSRIVAEGRALAAAPTAHSKQGQKGERVCGAKAALVHGVHSVRKVVRMPHQAPPNGTPRPAIFGAASTCVKDPESIGDR